MFLNIFLKKSNGFNKMKVWCSKLIMVPPKETSSQTHNHQPPYHKSRVCALKTLVAHCLHWHQCLLLLASSTHIGGKNHGFLFFLVSRNWIKTRSDFWNWNRSWNQNRRDYYRIGSNFWKFYLIRTDFTSGEPISLVKVFRLFRLERIVLVFRVWTQ